MSCLSYLCNLRLSYIYDSYPRNLRVLHTDLFIHPLSGSSHVVMNERCEIMRERWKVGLNFNISYSVNHFHMTYSCKYLHIIIVINEIKESVNLFFVRLIVHMV